MSTRFPRSLRVVQPHVRCEDPHVCTDDGSSLALRGALFEALVRRSDAATFAPALASAWRVAEDARRWTFVLRAGVLAHDGMPLEPRDVLASLERVRDPDVGGALGTEGVYAGYLQGARLTLAEERGVATLSIELERPMADLLDLLVDVPVIPERAHGRHARHPVGTGPYAVSRLDEDEVALSRWAGHWSSGARFETVTFRSEPNAESRAAAVRSGRAHLAAGLTPELANGLEGAAGLQVIGRPSSTCVAFFFGLSYSGAPAPISDVRVRQALHHATDVGALIERVLLGRARRLAGPFSELHLAFDPDVPAFGFDPQRASTLLAEAGWAGGLELTADVPTRLPDEAPAVAEELRQQWARVGVRLRVLSYADRLEYARMVREKRIHDLCCFDSAPISSYRVLMEKFHSGAQGPWWQGYRSAEVDELIERGAATTGTRARQALYRQAFRQLVHDAPWLWLYAPDRLWLASDALSGWQPSFDGVTVV